MIRVLTSSRSMFVNEKLLVACARTWCMRAHVGQQIDKSAKNEHQHFQYLWITINVLMFGTLLTLKAVEVGPNILYVCKYYFDGKIRIPEDIEAVS